MEVHVFGADQGESILIKFPNDEWGVVDCYAPSKDVSSNQALSYLLGKQITQLHFVCLTHPHHDHYSGLAQIGIPTPSRGGAVSIRIGSQGNLATSLQGQARRL